MDRRWTLAGSLVTLAAVSAGCGSSGSSSASVPSATSATRSAALTTAVPRVSTATVAGLGTVLVDGHGHTLYVFEPDEHAHVTCLSACAAVWPPLFAASGRPLASGAIQASQLGSDPDPAGGRVVTYYGWPLYRYAGDSAPGTANGQAEDLNGGLWYAISPSGRVITSNPAG